MNDRTLLELAAKAAGKLFNPTRIILKEGVWVVRDGAKHQEDMVLWNPLTSDGDALRLAVKLGMDIGHVAGQVYADDVFLFYCDYNDDPCVATRRAIVRAAAIAEQGEKE